MRLGGGLVYKGVPLKLGVCTPEIVGGTPEIWGRLYFGFKVPSKEGQDTHTHVVRKVSNSPKNAIIMDKCYISEINCVNLVC